MLRIRLFFVISNIFADTNITFEESIFLFSFEHYVFREEEVFNKP